jgi:hypothetical protein
MCENEKVLETLYMSLRKPAHTEVGVSRSTLQEAGWDGTMPTQVFTKFEQYWVRFVPVHHTYKIIKVERWMLEQKSEQQVDMNAPLPISGKPKFNLKEMYKTQVKDGDKPKTE